MELRSNPLLLGFRHETKNNIMVAYATFLLTGQNLMVKSIKVSTVKLYLKAVSDYFYDNKQFNPTLDEIGAQPRRLRAVYHEALRWEQMPNRSEALTVDMVTYLYDTGVESDEDSAASSLADWMILSLQTGFRVSEYAQPCSAIHMSIEDSVTKNINGTPKALCASDLFFSGPHRRPVNKNKRHCAAFVHITWRYQKNMQNGECIPFARNDRNPTFCPVRAAYRIIKRAERLRLNVKRPIAVSRSPNRKRKGLSYLTSGFIAKNLQLAAKAAHNITSADDLRKFTPHSPRVGACVLLHQLKKQPDYIKKRLRWRSDTYQDYLRHIDDVATDMIDDLSKYLA